MSETSSNCWKTITPAGKQVRLSSLIYNAFLSCRGNGVINEAGCWDYLAGMTSGAIQVSQVPESGRPRPLPPPIGCNLSTNYNRKRKPKWRRCVAASIAVGPSAIRTGSRTRPSDWGWNRRFGPVEDRRNNRRLATVTGGCLLFFLLYSPNLGMVQILGFSGNCMDRPRASTMEILSIVGPIAGSGTLDAVKGLHAEPVG